MKRGRNPPDSSSLDQTRCTIHYTIPPQSRPKSRFLCLSCTAHTTLVVQLLRTLRPVLHPRANATNRQPTTKIPTYNNVCSLFMRRTDFTVGSAFVPFLTLLAVSTPTAPRSFQDLLHQQEPKQGSLKISALFSSRWTLWVALRLPATAAIPHLISILPLRSYRNLNHSPEPLISPFLHIIIPAQYLTHSPGVMHTALTLIAQISTI